MKMQLKKWLFLAMISLTLVSCEEDGNGDEPVIPSALSRDELLANWSDALLRPQYKAYYESVELLKKQADAFMATPTVNHFVAMRGALRTARLAWQWVNFAEILEAENIALRSFTNIYPADTAKIKANILNENYNFGSVANIDAAGFSALDYLVYGIADDDTETVMFYSDATEGPKRLKYVNEITKALLNNAAQVNNCWQTGSCAEAFKAANGTDVGSSLSQIVNAANLYMERALRDGKIAIPAGVRTLGTPQPHRVEALYGGYSVELANQSILALENWYLGNSQSGVDGLGLDEFVDELNPDTDANIKEQFVLIKQMISDLPEPLNQTLTNNPAAGKAIFDEFQKLVILLKVDMPSLLGVSITYQDNDGD